MLRTILNFMSRGNLDLPKHSRLDLVSFIKLFLMIWETDSHVLMHSVTYQYVIDHIVKSYFPLTDLNKIFIHTNSTV